MINLENVLEAVVEVTDLPPYQIIGKSRKKDIAMARHLFCYLSRHHTNVSQEAIGEFLGGRHHSTVIHGIQTANDMLDTNYEVFVALVNSANDYIVKKYKQDNTILVTIPYGVEFTKIKNALEVFGCTFR